MEKEEMIAWLKQFENPDGNTTVAACDLSLLGKKLTLKRNNKEIIVNKNFYGGKKVDRDELAFHLERGDSLNLIGRKVVSTAEKMGAAHGESKIFLSTEEDEDVPHVQVYRCTLT